VAEAGPRRRPRRAPLPDDGGGHGIQPALHRLARRHRPRRPTYTIDTLRDLHAQRPDDELFFITGADALAQILSWKDSDELFDLARFIGVTRPGYELSESGLPADRVDLQEVPAMAISSTDCRERVARGEPVWYLVPDGVVQYISKHHLYSSPEAPSPHASPGAP
jgi:nicotinate-nucleotide adenylyltransferase